MVKKDELIVLTGGEYSDYHIVGHFRAKKDFSLRETRAVFIENLPMVPVLNYGDWVKKSPEELAKEVALGKKYINPEKYVRFETPVDTGELRKDYWCQDKFVAYLIREGFIDEVDVAQHNLDYLSKDA